MRKRPPSAAAVDRLITRIEHTTVGRTTLCFAQLLDGSIEVGCWCDTRGAFDPETGRRAALEQVRRRLARRKQRIKPRRPQRRRVSRSLRHQEPTE
ncbi:MULTISPECIES: hypothetical protein [Burkholderia cepacia complex]|jgi:hypothetical protein|uniref:hypothetical protein n=1 Tax=Burkholderia cepacia complex TaxID=87882 RepID=UPI00158E15D4|nr:MULTISPECIES: hypothetical protein [Burkholderia cepacia complex]MCA8037078.1 hypothetical protein [Burkholderia arboris]